MSMTLEERVKAAYQAELRRKPSHAVARQAVISQFGLSAGRVDALLRPASFATACDGLRRDGQA